MIRLRARQVHQKELRRQEILAAASALLLELPFQALTMAEVARIAGLAKGTIFIYFKTKEELFLVLLEEGLLRFFEGLDESLNASKMPLTPLDLARLFREAYLAQIHLVPLLGILHPILEHNLDRLTVLKFREFMANRMARSARYLEQRLPFLLSGQGLELMVQVHILALGAGQISQSSPVVLELRQAPGLQMFDRPFGPLFEVSLEALLLGFATAFAHQAAPAKGSEPKRPAPRKPVKEPSDGSIKISLFEI